MRYNTTVPICPCGSGKLRSTCVDGYGIMLFFYCEDCFADKRKRYRHDIFTKYKTDEAIEPEC